MLSLTPTKLGRYEIVDEIGKSAMGVLLLDMDSEEEALHLVLTGLLRLAA